MGLEIPLLRQMRRVLLCRIQPWCSFLSEYLLPPLPQCQHRLVDQRAININVRLVVAQSFSYSSSQRQQKFLLIPPLRPFISKVITTVPCSSLSIIATKGQLKLALPMGGIIDKKSIHLKKSMVQAKGNTTKFSLQQQCSFSCSFPFLLQRLMDAVRQKKYSKGHAREKRAYIITKMNCCYWVAKGVSNPVCAIVYLRCHQSTTHPAHQTTRIA